VKQFSCYRGNRYRDIGVGEIITALAAINSVILFRVQLNHARDQLDISKQYYYWYAKQRAIYKAYFQQGGTQNWTDPFTGSVVGTVTGPNAPFGERQLIAELQSAVPYTANYSLADGDVDLIRNQFSNLFQIGTMRRRSRMYGLNVVYGTGSTLERGIKSYIDSYFFPLKADVGNYSYRFEEHRERVGNERLFDRRSALMQYMLKKGAETARGQQVSMDFLNQARDGYANFIGQIGNNLAAGAGFSWGLKKTRDSIDSFTAKHVPKKYGSIGYVGIKSGIGDFISGSGGTSTFPADGQGKGDRLTVGNVDGG